MIGVFHGELRGFKVNLAKITYNYGYARFVGTWLAEIVCA